MSIGSTATTRITGNHACTTNALSVLEQVFAELAEAVCMELAVPVQDVLRGASSEPSPQQTSRGEWDMSDQAFNLFIKTLLVIEISCAVIGNVVVWGGLFWLVASLPSTLQDKEK